MARNERGEDFPKFLKELNDPQIMGILNDDPGMRVGNRQQRRAAKRPDEMERAIKDAELKDLERKHTEIFRSGKMGEFFRDVYKQILPRWVFDKVQAGDHKWRKILGYVHASHHGNDMEHDASLLLGHRLVPYSICLVARKRFIFFGTPMLLKVTMLELPDGEKTFNLAKGSNLCKTYDKQESSFKFIWG